METIVFPRSWKDKVVASNGRINANNCLVLSEIIRRCELEEREYIVTTYPDIAVEVNLSGGQVKYACQQLKEAGLLEKELIQSYRNHLGEKEGNVIKITPQKDFLGTLILDQPRI